LVKPKNFIKCPLCNEQITLRVDKHGNPYTYCNDCGMQMFIRKQEGIDKLKKLSEKG